jgi:hypothetical protein
MVKSLSEASTSELVPAEAQGSARLAGSRWQPAKTVHYYPLVGGEPLYELVGSWRLWQCVSLA